jgi:hypothetical protein
MSSNKKSLKLKKGGAFEYAKMFESSLSPCNKKNNMKGGSDPIPTYVDYSQGWHYANEENIPYAVDSSIGINEYQFGRLTPDNDFIVASGVVKNDTGIELTGGAKKKVKKVKKVVKKSKPVESAKKVKSKPVASAKKVKSKPVASAKKVKSKPVASPKKVKSKPVSSAKKVKSKPVSSAKKAVKKAVKKA